MRGLTVGDTVTVEGPSRRPREGDRRLDGQGLPGDDQEARVHARPRLARLAQRPQARLDRRVRLPSRVFKGMRMSGRMGGNRVTQPGLVVHEVDPSGTCSSSGLRARAGERPRGDRGGVGDGREETGAPALGSKKKEVRSTRPSSAPRSSRTSSTRPSAEMNAARAGTRGAKSRGLVAGGRSKPWRQKGTGRARAGTTRAPHWTGGGVAFPPVMRSFEVKVNRKARRAALRARSATTRGRHVRRPRRDLVRGALDQERSACSTGGA